MSSISSFVRVVGIYSGFPSELKLWNCFAGVVYFFYCFVNTYLFSQPVYVMLFAYKNETTIYYLQGQQHTRRADKISGSLKIDASPIRKGIFEHVSFIVELIWSHQLTIIM